METIAEVISVSNVTELVRVVWMEIAMASFAATVYFTFSGWLATPGKKPAAKNISNQKADKEYKPARKPAGKICEQEATPHQLVAKALRQGSIKSAIDLLQKLPEVMAGSVPTNLAPRLLTAVAKASDFDDVMTEMMTVLSGKIEARSLDAAVLEAARNKDVAACHQLQVMSRLLSIPKSHETLEALAKVHASDAVCLRDLIEDAEAPVSRTFAKLVLEACATLKDVDLAAEVFEKVADSDAPVLRGIVEKAAKEASVHSKEIRACGKNGDLDGAVQIFEQQHKHSANTLMYNSIIDACVECGNVEKALAYFSQARSSGLADAITYNTAMKGFLSQGKLDAATSLFAELSEKGLTPTLASYHGFLNFHVNARNSNGAWKVVEGMQAAGVLPTAVTCSILLKGRLDSPADLNRVFKLVDTIEPMDEVLFHTLADTCIRTRHLHLLSKYQEKLTSQGNARALTAPTYGSIIKAYGQTYDVKHCWDLWGEMIKNGVHPTAITLGCMVEALVSNWCTADAWKLVQEIRSDESTRSLVNTVIYSTILKGFAQAKETDKVMALYEEMKANSIHPNNITYNTILNAFAQGGAMDRVPALLDDMKHADPPAEPDIVTYSTIVKGYCNSGCLDRALEILKDMHSDGNFTPDEVMYNSLLDGCAKEHRPNDALKLLDDMRRTGVAPSNYTLSMMVKLMGRCKRLNQAFTLLEDISREYGLKVNIQVYTCLIQACFNNRQAAKAIAVHDQIIKEGLTPDEMTYSVLVKGCLQAGLVDKAVQLAKCAHGLAEPKVNSVRAPGINARCLDELVSALGGASSQEAKALVAEFAASRPSQGKGSSKGKGKSKGSDNTPPWR